MPYNCITQPQIRIINVLIGKNPQLKDHKAEIIANYTAGRSNSCSDMTMEEARTLIAALKQMEKKDPNAEKCDVMRKKIISMGHEMGWKTEEGKIKMEQINGWCKKYGYLKKKLDEYTYEELPRLVSQFEAMYKDYLDKI